MYNVVFSAKFIVPPCLKRIDTQYVLVDETFRKVTKAVVLLYNNDISSRFFFIELFVLYSGGHMLDIKVKMI